MAVVDVHAHWYPPSYVEALHAAQPSGGRDPRLPPPAFLDSVAAADLSYRLRLMDAAGIGVQILNAGAPEHPDPAESRALAQISNDGLASTCAENHVRFRFFAALPVPHIGESLDEIARTAQLTGCVGVTLPTHVAGTPLDDAQFLPVLEALHDHRRIVLLHPAGFRVPGLLSDWFMDWTIGAPFEDTIAALRLMASGRLNEFPDIRWIVPHLGGTLGFLLERLDLTWEGLGQFMNMERPSTLLGSLFFDTSASGPERVGLVARAVGPERLVHGSDYPFLHQGDLCPTVDRITSALPGESAQAERILTGAQLF